MAVETSDENEQQTGVAATADANDLRGLHRELLQRVGSAETSSDLLHALAELLDRYVAPVALFYIGRNDQGQLDQATRLRPLTDEGGTDRLARQMLAACKTACRAGEAHLRRQASPARTWVAAPIARQDRDPDALGVIWPSNQPPSVLLMLTQLLTSHIVLWHVISGSRTQDADSRDAAAVIELADGIVTAPDLRHACYLLAGELEAHLACGRVAVGLRTRARGRCRLISVSGVAQFDERSSTAQALESVMDEAVLRQEVTIWPGDDRQAGALAHSRLCSLEDSRIVASTPLRDHEEQAVGAVVVLGETDERIEKAARFFRAAERPLAISLSVARRLEGGRLTRLMRGLGRFWYSQLGKVAVVVLLLLGGVMMIRLPYKVHCDCQIEPVTRRYVAAPFEGTLEKSLVEPGDIVRQGDVLARMDGREVRWKRASIEADQKQAYKRRDAAQASHNYADQQIAQLEIERLSLELQLLDHRGENLEIRSPVDGIVVSGDLERAEGAPLTVGQTLFEVAPLNRMIVEVSVPDDDTSFIRAGQTIDVRLDAYPNRVWPLRLKQIQPRSEIRDERNVFIAEAELENPDNRLRPGMKGRAKVVTDRRPIGWILFHKPWEYATKKLSW